MLNVIERVITRVLRVSCLHELSGMTAVPMKHRQPMKMLIMLTRTCQMTGALPARHAGQRQADLLVEATAKDDGRLE